MKNCYSCSNLYRSLGCPRKPWQMQDWGKWGWLMLYTLSGSEVHAWLFSTHFKLYHCCHAVLAGRCCIWDLTMALYSRKLLSSRFSQNNTEVYSNLDSFLKSQEKAMVWKIGLQTLEHASNFSASVHMLPYDNKIPLGEMPLLKKARLLMCVNWYLMNFVHHLLVTSPSLFQYGKVHP